MILLIKEEYHVPTTFTIKEFLISHSSESLTLQEKQIVIERDIHNIVTGFFMSDNKCTYL